MSALDGIKAGGVHFPAFIADSSAISALSLNGWQGLLGDDERGLGPYAFFFTSLTLEKVIPSARSRV
jgi:hypothetical protein